MSYRLGAASSLNRFLPIRISGKDLVRQHLAANEQVFDTKPRFLTKIIICVREMASVPLTVSRTTQNMLHGGDYGIEVSVLQ